MIDTKEIFNFVLQKLNDIKKMAESVDFADFDGNKQNEERKKQIENANANLDRVRNEIRAELETLQRVGEFDTYTIAFYGATNAGKSTLIEALRLYFNEPSKKAEQGHFDKIWAEFSVENSRISQNLAQLKEQIFQLQKEISQKESVVQEKQGFFVNFLAFFNPNSPKRVLKKLKESLKIAQNDETKNTKDREKLFNSKSVKELLETNDGAIIGYGVQDFTKESKIFHFENQGENFDILDMPGIEGNENKVINEIVDATKKAHCVFYITRKAKIEDETLEKIKRHLGAQTEVYVVFNKPTQSPENLQESLIKDKEGGLKDLNELLRKSLNEHYKGIKHISASGAFLALSKNLLEESLIDDMQKYSLQLMSEIYEKLKREQNNDFFNKRLNFLKEFGGNYDKNELLEKSGFKEFVQFICEITKNGGDKISISNFNKAYKVLDDLQLLLDKMQVVFDDIYEGFKSEVENANDELDGLKNGIEGKINSALNLALRNFADRVRDEMDRFIDNETKRFDFSSDKKCQSKLEQVLKKHENSIEKAFTKRYNEIQDEFKKDKDNTIKYLQNRLRKLAKNFQNINISSKFGNIDINIDSGLDKMKLLNAGVGVIGIVLAPATGGWSLILTVAGIVIAFWKSIKGVFDLDGKKAELKNKVNDILDKITKKAKEENKTKIKETAQSFKSHIDEIQKEIIKYAENLREVAEFFKNLKEKEVKIQMREIKTQMNAIKEKIKNGGLK